MRFVSFAQNFEDVMLWRALGHVERGFYIDVGAWSPELDSVTKAFYDRGWNGINVEANPDLHTELQTARPRDINLQLAATDTEGIAELSIVRSGTGLSTLDKAIAFHHAADGHKVAEPLTVTTSTLAAICRDHVPAGMDIHFLKIDVEGAEEAVIRGADWVRYRPWIVVVEATRPMSQIETHMGWEPVLLNAGYTLAYRDGLNRFYVAQEQSRLVAAFTYPPNMFDDYMLAATQRAEDRAMARASALEKAVNELQQDIRWLESTIDTMQASWLWQLTQLFQLFLAAIRRAAKTASEPFSVAARTFMQWRWRTERRILGVWNRVWRKHDLPKDELTPRARQIYAALKTAIVRRWAA